MMRVLSIPVTMRRGYLHNLCLSVLDERDEEQGILSAPILGLSWSDLLGATRCIAQLEAGHRVTSLVVEYMDGSRRLWTRENGEHLRPQGGVLVMRPRQAFHA